MARNLRSMFNSKGLQRGAFLPKKALSTSKAMSVNLGPTLDLGPTKIKRLT
jgi:hypothetical protein